MVPLGFNLCFALCFLGNLCSLGHEEGALTAVLWVLGFWLLPLRHLQHRIFVPTVASRCQVNTVGNLLSQLQSLFVCVPAAPGPPLHLFQGSLGMLVAFPPAQQND